MGRSNLLLKYIPFEQEIQVFHRHQAWIHQLGNQRKFLSKEKEVRAWRVLIIIMEITSINSKFEETFKKIF